MLDAAATPIERAIRKAGSEAKLGEAIGFSQVAVNKAKHGRPSPEMAMAIEKWSEGDVRACELRPDLPWPSAIPLEQQPSA